MSVTISLTEDDIFTALRTVLLSWTTNVECVRGQVNRVPEPTSDDFIVMLPVSRDRIGTNVVTFSDGYPESLPTTRTDTQSTKYTIQLDIHGPSSADNTQTIATLWRSDAACDAFTASGYAIQPLYAADPRQLAFVDGEQQFEDRWILDVVLQADIAITSPQDFASTVVVTTTLATSL